MKIKIKLNVFCALAVQIITGCASHDHNPPQPSAPEPTRGVSSYAPDKFRIVFDGTRWTKPQRAADFAMLRAADTTLQHGYSYFVVLNESDTIHSRSFSTPISANIQHYGAQTVTSVYGGNSGTISWPYITLAIQTFTNNVEGSLDAAWLKQSLFQQYHLDKTP